MPQVVHLGPLALALDRLVAIAGIWLFLAATAWIARRSGGRADRAGWIAVAAGLVAARLAFVVQNLAAFAMEPLAAIYVWQGGFSAPYGFAAAALTLAALLRGPIRRKSLLLLLLLAGTWLAFERIARTAEARPLPATAVATRLDGRAFDFRTLRGRPFVVNLWATWCPPCRREMPMLVEVARANPEVPVLLLNQGESSARVSAYLREEGLAVESVLLDPDFTFSAAAGGGGALPTTLFVDADGRISRTHSGEISRAALIAAITEMKENWQ